MATRHDIAEKSAALVDAIQRHEAAKLDYEQTRAALQQATEVRDAAHAVEVEAHAALATELRSRRRTRR